MTVRCDTGETRKTDDFHRDAGMIASSASGARRWGSSMTRWLSAPALQALWPRHALPTPDCLWSSSKHARGLAAASWGSATAGARYSLAGAGPGRGRAASRPLPRNLVSDCATRPPSKVPPVPWPANPNSWLRCAALTNWPTGCLWRRRGRHQTPVHGITRHWRPGSSAKWQETAPARLPEFSWVSFRSQGSVRCFTHSPISSRTGGLHRSWASTVRPTTANSSWAARNALTDRLGERLGDTVRLDSPVLRILHGPDGVTAFTDDGAVSARRAIVTMPPVLAGRLVFDPPMPSRRDYLTQRMPIRGKVAFAALYDEPFWRDTPGVSSISTRNVLAWDEGGDDDPACFSGLCSIARSRELAAMPPDERSDAVLGDLADSLGPRALDVVGYHAVDWAAEPWSRRVQQLPRHRLMDRLWRCAASGGGQHPLGRRRVRGALHGSDGGCRRDGRGTWRGPSWKHER